MQQKFRAWDKLRKRISVVDRIYFDTEGVQLRDDGGLYWRHFYKKLAELTADKFMTFKESEWRSFCTELINKFSFWEEIQ